MYLLYLDASGNVDDASGTYFVLGGGIIFDRQVYWQDLALEGLAEKIAPGAADSIEFHGSPMATGNGRWRRVRKETRRQLIHDALSTVEYNRGTRLLGIAVNKRKVSPEDPAERAFEEAVNRFDLFLKRQYARNNLPERGLIIFDKSRLEERFQALTRTFRSRGHRWGTTRNIVEVPLFVDSAATRLVQLADLVSYSLFRAYEHQDHQYLAPIETLFDQEGGVLHGLTHITWEKELASCVCVSCAQRRNSL